MSAFAIDTMKYLERAFELSEAAGAGRIIMMQFAVDDDSGCYFGVNDKSIRDLIPYEQEKTIQGQPPLPQSILLGRNFPNPFNGTTSIPFELPADRHVRLSVHDKLGRLVKVLVDADIKAGTHVSLFESVDLPSDVYYVRLAVGETVLTQGLILIR